MKKRVFVLSLMAVVFLNFASAGMIISQNNTSFSRGDVVDLNVLVNSDKAVSNYLLISLVCGDSTLEVYKSPLMIKVGEQKSVDLQINLDKSAVGEMSGSCYVGAKFDEQEAKGNNFEISSEVDVAIGNFSSIFSPGDSVTIAGTAAKRNKQLLEGSVEISSADMGVSFVGSVSGGNFVANFSIPTNAKAKIYSLEIKAYDQDYSGEVANLGISNSSIEVRQVLTSVDIALGETNITPGSNLSYSVVSLDQAGDYMTASSEVSIVGPNGENINQTVLGNSAETAEVLTNSTPGRWVINAVSDGFNVTKEFFVQEYRHARYELAGNILNAINDGNVPYSGPIEIKIGDKIFLKHVDLEVGGRQRYTLSAPDGDYDISVQEGSQQIPLGRAYLTGDAIGVGDIKKNSIPLLSFAWILLVVILGVIALLYYRRKRKWYYGSDYSGSSKPDSSRRSMSMGSLTPVRADEIQNGKKEKSSVVVLKIRNASQLAGNQEFAQVLGGIVDSARAKRADVKRGGDIMTIVFAQSLAGEIDLPFSAVELGKVIANRVDSYNKSALTKASYGIGVNEGELITEKTDGVFKYMGFSNTLAAARKLADSADKEVLISTNVHALTRAKVRVEKSGDGWKVAELKDNSKYVDFVSKFKQRQAREGF